MENLPEQLRKAAQGVVFNLGRKQDIRHKIAAYMDTHPGNTPMARRRTWTGIISALSSKRTAVSGLVAALMLVLGGGTVAAARTATPDHPLYDLKTGVERIRTNLTFDADARAQYEAELSARRIQEAQVLAAEGRLDTVTEAQLIANFERHADNVRDRISSLREAKPELAENLSSRFEQSLAV